MFEKEYEKATFRCAMFDKEKTFKMEQLLHLSDENSFNFKAFFL